MPGWKRFSLEGKGSHWKSAMDVYRTQSTEKH